MRIPSNPKPQRNGHFHDGVVIVLITLSLTLFLNVMLVYSQPPIYLRSAPIHNVRPALPPLERGLWLDASNAIWQAIAMINGKRVVAASGSNNVELKHSIALSIDNKITELQSAYGVTISRAGEVYSQNNTFSCRTRDPMLAELLALEYALSHTNSSLIPRRKIAKTLRFCFLTETNCPGAIADWSLDANDKPVIAIEPAVTDSYTLESVLLHELSHHSQYCMGLNPKEIALWKTGIAAGWHYFQNPGTGETGWAIRTKDHKLFKFAQRLHLWVRCNDKGQPLNIDGQRVKRQSEAEQQQHWQISKAAIIRPATYYFCNPAEMLAEGMMLFRMNEETRAYLMRVSPELYDFVKAEDQRELDKNFGNTVKIRTPDGLVVDNNNSARISVSNFESTRDLPTLVKKVVPPSNPKAK